MPNRKDRARVTLADVVANILLKQYDWMKFLVRIKFYLPFEQCLRHDVQHSEDYNHLWDTPHPVWVEWRKSPSYDPIWVVAIRKTLPDRFGNAHYIPELELRFK